MTIVPSHSDPEGIATFYLPSEEGMPTLLFSHGNACDIGLKVDTFELLHQKGFGILAYDYPGYGLSKGSPSEKECYRAADVAWNYLTTTLQINPEQIIIYGNSVGSGPSCWLAEYTNPYGLVLVAPFASVIDVVISFIPEILPSRLGLLSKPLVGLARTIPKRLAPFPNINRIKNIHLPLLVIHGDQDEVIPQSQGKALHDKHPGDHTFVNIQGGTHNDLYGIGKEVILDTLLYFWKNNCTCGIQS